MSVVPGWLRSYRREWLGADLVAGLIVWSVVTPQAVAYAQIAGLPPQAGLIAAPGALLGYALLGSSHVLVVSATTATSALSAAAVGPLADGDTARFAALSAALALVVAAVLIAAGLLKLGGITDFVSKPVVTGFLFGIGLTVSVSQLPAVLGVDGGDGEFFGKLWDLLSELGDVHGWTLAVGAGSLVALVLLKRFAPRLPGSLVVLVAAIVLSALLGLGDKGVAVVGELPEALPDPAVPDVAWGDLVDLLPAAFGVMIVATEALGVSRALASKDGYQIDVNRELYAMGTANALAGLSSGFVQSGGASQTAAAENAGGRSQLTTVVAAVLIALTGAFFVGLFRDLPQATLSAIVIVAVASFVDVAELRRYAGLRTSAVVFALIALAGVLVLGVLPGLVIAALLSLASVVQRLGRPPVRVTGREGDDLHVRVDGPLFYANSMLVKDHAVALATEAKPPPATVVLRLDQTDIDVESLDMLAELSEALAKQSIELRLGAVEGNTLELLRRRGIDHLVRKEHP